MKQVTVKDIGGEIIKDNDQYLLKDNKFGNKLVCKGRRCYLY